jgi:perosamine synthetase
MDTDPASLGTAPEEIERRLTPATAAVVVVHVGGLVSARMPEVEALCARRGVPLVEDAAHAHGSSLAGRQAGTFGVAAAFSFYPTKVMTSAEGGMIVTRDERLAAEARAYRDQGKASFERNAHTHLGYNWRLSEPHAIIGVRHLTRLPEMIAARQRVAAIYNRRLAALPALAPLSIPAGGASNHTTYVARRRRPLDRGELKRTLRERHQVSLSGEVYEEPLHRQPVFGSLAREPLPVSEEVCARHVCLPVFASMTDAQAERVVDALADVLGERA